MANGTLAQLILSQRAPDIVGAFQRGREEARQERVRTLAGEAFKTGGGEALDELRGIDPQIALSIGETIRAQSAADINEFIRDAGIGKRMLESGNTQGFLAFTQQRSNILRQQGRDTQQTDRLRDLVAAGQPEQALQELQAFDSALGQSKGLTAAEQEFQSLTEGLSPEDVERAKRIQLGLDPRAISRRSVEEEGQIVLSKEQAKEAVKLSRENLDLLKQTGKAIGNIDDAIRALDRGAKTGVIESQLPSVRAASIELQNIGDRMGLDVIGSTTFGALSESELNFALSAALPTALNEKDLRKWLVEKKRVQKKLASELRDAAIFFGKGGTIPKFLERQTGREDRQGEVTVNFGQQQSSSAPALNPLDDPAQVGAEAARARQRVVEVDF